MLPVCVPAGGFAVVAGGTAVAAGGTAAAGGIEVFAVTLRKSLETDSGSIKGRTLPGSSPSCGIPVCWRWLGHIR